jgi:RTX calcium-binding nonapeptide repeat (4 copies)
MERSTLRRAGALLVSAALLASLSIAAVTPAASAAKPTCAGKVATIVSRKAVINGTAKADVIVAKGTGSNIINGKGGADRICGGPGNDKLLGGPGKDILNGGSGLDDCRPGGGSGSVRGCEYADYSIKLVCPDSAAEGEEFTCSLDITNHGPGAFKYTYGIYREQTRNDFYCAGQPSQVVFPSIPAGHTVSHDPTIMCWGDEPGGDTVQFWAHVETARWILNGVPGGVDTTCDYACMADYFNTSNNASGPETVVVS